MAVILHGDGLSCFKHVRSHHHAKCHSHGHKPEHSHYNNNKANFEYKPLIDDSGNTNGSALTNGDACAHQCSTQTKSIGVVSSRQYQRSCNMNKAVALVGDCPDKLCRHHHLVDAEPSHTLTLDTTTKLSPRAHNCVSSASTICPVHHYIHRDSSEHSPIGSSDSDDLAHESRTSAWSFGGHHDHHHHNSSNIGNHSGHTHDFSSKNINIQAAVIHVIGDFIQSIGVFISAVIIKYFVSSILWRFTIDFSWTFYVEIVFCQSFFSLRRK